MKGVGIGINWRTTWWVQLVICRLISWRGRPWNWDWWNDRKREWIRSQSSSCHRNLLMIDKESSIYFRQVRLCSYWLVQLSILRVMCWEEIQTRRNLVRWPCSRAIEQGLRISRISLGVYWFIYCILKKHVMGAVYFARACETARRNGKRILIDVNGI